MQKTIRGKVYYELFPSLYPLFSSLDGYRSVVREIISSFSFIKSADHILDAGCGDGLVSFSLADKFSSVSVVGFDISREMIQKSLEKKDKKHYSNISFYLGDFEDPSNLLSVNGIERILRKEEFDHIFVAGALEYSDANETIRRLSPYLKKGGNFIAIIIRDNAHGKLVGRMTGFKPYSQKEILSFFHNDGYAPEALTLYSSKKWASRFLSTVVAKKS